MGSMPVLMERACLLYFFVMAIQVSEIYLPIIKALWVKPYAQKKIVMLPGLDHSQTAVQHVIQVDKSG